MELLEPEEARARASHAAVSEDLPNHEERAVDEDRAELIRRSRDLDCLRALRGDLMDPDITSAASFPRIASRATYADPITQAETSPLSTAYLDRAHEDAVRETEFLIDALIEIKAHPLE